MQVFVFKKKMVNEKVICGKWSFFVTEVPILARCHSQMDGFLSKKTDLLTFFIFFILNLQLLMPSLSEYGTNKETPPIQSSFLPILHWHVNYMTVTSHRFIQQIPPSAIVPGHRHFISVCHFLV